VYGHLSNQIKLSVTAGSYHDNYLTLEYTRKGWLPLGSFDKQRIEIKQVIPSALSVVSSNVHHPTQDLMVVTIGEDVILHSAVHIPVSTNANFTLNINGAGFEGIAGHVIQVGRNIKSLQGQIRGTSKCTVTIF